MSELDVSAMVATLAAKEAIKSLKNKYFRALDQQLFTEVASCFSNDAVIDYGPAGVYEGVDGFVTMISDYAKTSSAKGIHQGYNPEITISGDVATAKWVCTYLSVDSASGISHKQTGTYEDEFVCVDGQWLISKTINRPLFHETLSVDGETLSMSSMG